jgi:hypothetical protein
MTAHTQTINFLTNTLKSELARCVYKIDTLITALNNAHSEIEKQALQSLLHEAQENKAQLMTALKFYQK